MSTGERDGNLPRSMRQRRILDVAAEHPDASIEEIASRIPTATADLVDRVLDEYGDPGANESADSSDFEMSDNEPQDSEYRAELTDKQRAVLELVREDPGATQRELGERLGISAAAVSNRVSDVDGFEWSDRLAFVEAVLDDEEDEAGESNEDGVTVGNEDDTSNGSKADTSEGDGAPPAEAEGDEQTESDTHAATEQAEGSSADTATDRGVTETGERVEEEGPTLDELARTVDELAERVDKLEPASGGADSSGRVADGGERSATSAETAPFDDPELVQKVAHACLRDENITEAEERRILQALLS